MHMYIEYMTSKHILLIAFLNEPESNFYRVQIFYLFLYNTNNSIYN